MRAGSRAGAMARRRRASAGPDCSRAASKRAAVSNSAGGFAGQSIAGAFGGGFLAGGGFQFGGGGNRNNADPDPNAGPMLPLSAGNLGFHGFGGNRYSLNPGLGVGSSKLTFKDLQERRNENKEK